MAEFINLQVYGVPVLTYGLIGATTAVLAYATYVSGVGETISNVATTGSLPDSSVGDINPLSAFAPSTTKEADASESVIDDLNPFASSEGEPKETEEETESDEKNEKNTDEPTKTTGGKKGRKSTKSKKRNRKTPKSKNGKGAKKHKNKTIKRK
jgi:hypothetical protein